MSNAAVKTETPSLDERIAALLAANPADQPSAIFGLYLFQIDTAISVAEREGKAALARALDPSVVDGTARGIAHDSEYAVQRYKVARERLTVLRDAAVRREKQAVWNADAEEIELKVAQAADQVIEVYPRCVHELIELFQLMARVDQEVIEINSRKPAGCTALRSVELVARKINAFGQHDLKIADKTQLPGLSVGHGQGSTLLVWPPAPSRSVTLQYYDSVTAMLQGAPPPLTGAERVAASVAESQRQMDYIRSQERGRELKNSEAAKRAAGG
jgi:hypothetical protein